MANRSRDFEIADLAIHDKKALEWFVKLDHSAHKLRAEVEIRVRQAMAERRALVAADVQPFPGSGGPGVFNARRIGLVSGGRSVFRLGDSLPGKRAHREIGGSLRFTPPLRIAPARVSSGA